MYLLVCRIDLELEIGARASAAKSARRLEQASSGWLRSDYVDLPSLVTRALYLSGAIDRERRNERRTLEVPRLAARGGYFSSAGLQWYETYAQTTVYEVDATEAIKRLPERQPTIEAVYRDIGVDEEIGRNYLLAGHYSEAVVSLRRATKSCNYRKSIHHIQAYRYLGDALSGVDRRGACDAYAHVIEHWGHDPALSRCLACMSIRSISHLVAFD